MDRQLPSSKPRRGLWIAAGLGVSLVVGAFTIFPSLGKLAMKQGGFLFGIVAQTYIDAGKSVQRKVESLSQADQDRHRLNIENAQLRQDLALLRFKMRSLVAERSTEKIGLKLNRETGTRLGRTLASISYKPPSHLKSSQLLTLAASYFKAHENEKAAVILTTLMNLKETQTYRTAQNLLMTAIAWYRLDHLVHASTYLDQILKLPTDSSSRRIKTLARLWKAVLAERMKQEGKTQAWLKRLIEHDPHSEESSWVNPKGAKRATASH